MRHIIMILSVPECVGLGLMLKCGPLPIPGLSPGSTGVGTRMLP